MRLKNPCYAYDTTMPQYMLTAYAWCNEMKIYKLQENNKEGAAFVSNVGQNTMRYPWTKLYFSAQLHITAALVFDVKFHSSIDIESKIGGGPGPEYRTRRPGEHCGAPGCR